jgi:hypothetical protein
MLADVMMADEARRGFEGPDLIESKALLNAVGPGGLAGKPLYLMAGDMPRPSSRSRLLSTEFSS